jgi:hypothetical protein
LNRDLTLLWSRFIREQEERRQVELLEILEEDTSKKERGHKHQMWKIWIEKI